MRWEGILINFRSSQLMKRSDDDPFPCDTCWKFIHPYEEDWRSYAIKTWKKFIYSSRKYCRFLFTYSRNLAIKNERHSFDIFCSLPLPSIHDLRRRRTFGFNFDDKVGKERKIDEHESSTRRVIVRKKK